MKKILVIKHGALGDVILSLHALTSIQNHFVNSRITVLTEKKYINIFKHFKFIDEIRVDNRRKLLSLINFIGILFWFKRKKFDWVFDLQTSKRTSLYFKILSIFNDFKWNGIAKGCSHIHDSYDRKSLHTLDRHRQQLRIAGIVKFKNVDWSVFKHSIKDFKIPKKFVVLVAGGAKSRPDKRWDLKNYLSLANYFEKNSIYSVFVGGKDEIHMLDIRLKKSKFIINLVGKTSLEQLASISRLAFMVIGNDTGPMHLICVCSKSIIKKIVLFGSDSDPTLCAPRAKNIKIIRKNKINNITVNEIKFLIKKNI